MVGRWNSQDWLTVENKACQTNTRQEFMNFGKKLSETSEYFCWLFRCSFCFSNGSVFSVNLVYKKELDLMLKVSETSSQGEVGFELKRHWLLSTNSATVQNTSTSDAIKIWNQAPTSVTECKTLHQVKTAIKAYCKSLPI